MDAKIKAISYYLPERILTNSELAKAFPEWSVEKVANKIGISERHISAENELSSDMAIKAAEKLFSEHQLDRSIIDFIMLCTQSPDYYLPTSACIIQDKLCMPTNIGAIDFNLGCSGFVYGLAMGKGLIKGGIAKNILLITSETYTKFIHEGDKSNRTIFGDAAAATLISTDGFATIEEFDLGTDGKGAENLIVRNGGLRNQKTGSPGEPDEFGNIISSDHLFMNGSEVFNFTIDTVPKLVSNVLSKNNLSKDDVDLFVFHQANKYMLNNLRTRLGIEEKKFYSFLEKVGNTVSSTIPVALNEAMKENQIQKGSHVLLAGFGVGYSWGGTVLKY
jgi:3-oxoacyl-[acyl-carrier-protein] synthase-3